MRNLVKHLHYDLALSYFICKVNINTAKGCHRITVKMNGIPFPLEHMFLVRLRNERIGGDKIDDYQDFTG